MPAEVKDLKPNIVAVMASKYMLSPEKFTAVVKKTCGLAQATEEEFFAFLLIANQHDLNPLVRELYAFQRPGGGLQFIVGYDGWVTVMNRNPAFRGISFKDDIQGGQLVAVTCIIRKAFPDGTIGTVEKTEYMRECKRNTDPWNKMPARMLTIKATNQCVRLAFNLAGVMDPDEWERWTEMHVERQKLNQQAGSTPLDSAEDIPGEPGGVVEKAGPSSGAKASEIFITDPEPETKPEPEPPKDEFITLEDRNDLEDLITSYGWSHRVIAEVIQENAGCPIDQILQSQLQTIARKIQKAGEARKKEKK
jgi:hypothetical protein